VEGTASGGASKVGARDGGTATKENAVETVAAVVDELGNRERRVETSLGRPTLAMMSMNWGAESAG
jgi:hypothetical protein